MKHYNSVPEKNTIQSVHLLSEKAVDKQSSSAAL